MNGSWLPLTDYSTKYRVSVSTLRRKIKAEDIKYRFADGKYFIIDEPSDHGSDNRSVHPAAGPHRPSQVSNDVQQAQAPEAAQNITEKLKSTILQGQQKEEPVLTAANRLLGELKKAYTLILQEKEEQILNLREEVTDLKTLVRVLENENERLTKRF